jgi:hypothetical protein
MAGDVHDLLDAVHDRESFLEFVRALANDRRVEASKESPDEARWDAGPWANATIESFLDAAVAWAEAQPRLGSEDTPMGPRTNEFPEEVSWQSFANFLYAGKIYE